MDLGHVDDAFPVSAFDKVANVSITVAEATRKCLSSEELAAR